MKYVEYVTIEKRPECFICEAIKSDKDRENLVLYRSKLSIVLLNKFPYNTGHLLIAPKRHVPSLEDLTTEELTDLMVLVKRCLRLLRTVYRPDAFNVGINIGRVAGAGLEEHVHIHIVPRWNGDTNFMPIIASTKVIPEALYDTYDKLKKFIELLEKD